MVLGYSVKSIGIATDLFGTYEGYVIPVQGMDSTTILTQAFWKLYDKRVRMREDLENRLPSYLEQAISVGDRMRELLEGENNL